MNLLLSLLYVCGEVSGLEEDFVFISPAPAPPLCLHQNGQHLGSFSCFVSRHLGFYGGRTSRMFSWLNPSQALLSHFLDCASTLGPVLGPLGPLLARNLLSQVRKNPPLSIFDQILIPILGIWSLACLQQDPPQTRLVWPEPRPLMFLLEIFHLGPALLLGCSPACPSRVQSWAQSLCPSRPVLSEVLFTVSNKCREQSYRLQWFLWSRYFTLCPVSTSGWIVLASVWLILSQVGTTLNLLSPCRPSLLLNFEPVDCFNSLMCWKKSWIWS